MQSLSPISLLFLLCFSSTVCICAGGRSKLKYHEKSPAETKNPNDAPVSGGGPNWDYNWGGGSGPGTGWGYGSGSGSSSTGFGRGFGFGFGVGTGSGSGFGYGWGSGGARGGGYGQGSGGGSSGYAKSSHGWWLAFTSAYLTGLRLNRMQLD